MSELLGLSQNNMLFLQEKQRSGKLEQVIALARIIDDRFPELVLSSESKLVASSVVNIVENAIKSSLSTLTSVTELLSQIAQKVPEDVRKQISTIITKLEAMESTSGKSSDAILQTFNQLVNKPNIKGKTAEKTLSGAWQMSYVDDVIDEKSNADKSDFLVTPKFKDGFGNKISVERKAGVQKYNARHMTEAITHAKEDGAKYAIIVYDSAKDNLPDVFGPIYIQRTEGIVIVVTDVENSGWMIARYIFSVLEQSFAKEQTYSVDFDRISERIKDMYTIKEHISKLRKKNNTAIQACEGLRESINCLESVFENNLRKLEQELNPTK